MAQEGTPITRRSMLQMSCGGFATAGVATISGSWPLLKLDRHRLRDVTAETFLPYVGKTLVLERPSEGCTLFCTTAELQLVAVSPHAHLSRLEDRTVRAERKRESFSLMFKPDTGSPPESGLYRLRHIDFEGVQILLTRVGVVGRDGSCYLEAVFG